MKEGESQNFVEFGVFYVLKEEGVSKLCLTRGTY